VSKRIEKDGKFYRMRRGKLVEIPPKWVGKTVDKQTTRKRDSRLTKAQRTASRVYGGYPFGGTGKPEAPPEADEWNHMHTSSRAEP
jgi:hypothetical protein